MTLYDALLQGDGDRARSELDRLLSAKQTADAVRQVLLAGCADTTPTREDPHGLLVAVAAAQTATLLGDAANGVLLRAASHLATLPLEAPTPAPADAYREATYAPAALYAALVEGDRDRAFAALRPAVERGGFDAVAASLCNIAPLHMEGAGHAAVVPLMAVAAAKLLEGEDALVPLVYACESLLGNRARGRLWGGGWFPEPKQYYEWTLARPGPRGHHLTLAHALGELLPYADEQRRTSLLRQLQLNLQQETAAALPAPAPTDALLAKLAPGAAAEAKAAVESKKAVEILKVAVANLAWPADVEPHSLIALGDAVFCANALGPLKVNVGLNTLAHGLPFR